MLIMEENIHHEYIYKDLEDAQNSTRNSEPVISTKNSNYDNSNNTVMPEEVWMDDKDISSFKPILFTSFFKTFKQKNDSVENVFNVMTHRGILESEVWKTQMSLYDELIAAEVLEREEKFKRSVKYEELWKKYKELQKENFEKDSEISKLKNQNITLKKNSCSLFKTAKDEIERKDIMLAEAHREIGRKNIMLAELKREIKRKDIMLTEANKKLNIDCLKAVNTHHSRNGKSKQEHSIEKSVDNVRDMKTYSSYRNENKISHISRERKQESPVSRGYYFRKKIWCYKRKTPEKSYNCSPRKKCKYSAKKSPIKSHSKRHEGKEKCNHSKQTKDSEESKTLKEVINNKKCENQSNNCNTGYHATKIKESDDITTSIVEHKTKKDIDNNFANQNAKRNVLKTSENDQSLVLSTNLSSKYELSSNVAEIFLNIGQNSKKGSNLDYSEKKRNKDISIYCNSHSVPFESNLLTPESDLKLKAFSSHQLESSTDKPSPLTSFVVKNKLIHDSNISLSNLINEPSLVALISETVKDKNNLISAAINSSITDNKSVLAAETNKPSLTQDKTSILNETLDSDQNAAELDNLSCTFSIENETKEEKASSNSTNALFDIFEDKTSTNALFFGLLCVEIRQSFMEYEQKHIFFMNRLKQSFVNYYLKKNGIAFDEYQLPYKPKCSLDLTFEDRISMNALFLKLLPAEIRQSVMEYEQKNIFSMNKLKQSFVNYYFKNHDITFDEYELPYKQQCSLEDQITSDQNMYQKKDKDSLLFFTNQVNSCEFTDSHGVLESVSVEENLENKSVLQKISPSKTDAIPLDKSLILSKERKCMDSLENDDDDGNTDSTKEIPSHYRQIFQMQEQNNLGNNVTQPSAIEALSLVRPSELSLHVQSKADSSRDKSLTGIKNIQIIKGKNVYHRRQIKRALEKKASMKEDIALKTEKHLLLCEEKQNP